MYLSPKKHILSNTIMIAAIIRIAEFGIFGIYRMYIGHRTVDAILAEHSVRVFQTILSVCTLMASAFVFIYALYKTGAYISVIPGEDREELAKLQQETFGTDNSALTADVIRKLLRIWFAILVGAQLMYDISSGIYSRFTGYLNMAIPGNDASTVTYYSFIYNLTHGFKYQGMLVALLLGIVVTAIFLNDKTLKLIAYVIAVLFVISSMGMEMAKFTMLGNTLGIVWSSVIFHTIDTVGLLAFAIHMRIRYRGV